jgi:hypothetical protein
VSAEFVAAMENVLDLYEEPYDPLRPIVGFDESPKQLIEEVRQPISPAPGSPARYDTEYERQGGGDEFHMDYTLTQPPFSARSAEKLCYLIPAEYPSRSAQLRETLDSIHQAYGKKRFFKGNKLSINNGICSNYSNHCLTENIEKNGWPLINK